MQRDERKEAPERIYLLDGYPETETEAVPLLHGISIPGSNEKIKLFDGVVTLVSSKGSRYINIC